MEPTSQGRTEKSFSYVIRVPGSDGSDVMDVDLKIDTCWIFQDAADSGGEQGRLPEEVAGSLDVDTGGLRRQLESLEQNLVATADKGVPLESPELRSRVRELELAERKLLRRVDVLSTRLVRERSASLRAHEQLRALQAELASQVREEELKAQRQREQLRRWRERLRLKDEALGLQAAALEHCRQSQRRQLGLVRGQERVLRAQVQRLERDVRRLCRATGLLLAQVGTSAGALGSPKALAEPRALQAKAESTEREGAQAARRLREPRAGERGPCGQLEQLGGRVSRLRLSEMGLPGREKELAEHKHGLRLRGAAGSQALQPGQLSEGLCTCGCVGDGQGPCVMVPDPETTSEFPEECAGSECEQLSLAEPSPDGQVLLLVCGCPPGPSPEASLCPLDPAWISESLTAIQEPRVLAQASVLPLWGPSRDAGSVLPLLLQEPPEGLQAQEELDTRPVPAPRPTVHPGWDCHQARSHLCQESARTSNHTFLRAGPMGGLDTWNKGGGTSAGTVEEGEVRRASARVEGGPGAKWKLGHGDRKDLSLGTVARASEGGQDDHEAPETPAPACSLWLRQECPVLLLRGGALEGPQPLSRSRRGEGCGSGFLEGLSSARENTAPPATGSRTHGIGALQFPVGRDRDPWILQDGKDRKWHLGSTLALQEEGEQEGAEEEGKLPPGDASSLGNSPVPGQPDSQALMGQEMLSCAGERSLLQPASLAVLAARCEAPSSPLGKRRDGCVLQIDEFEREVEACFQQLHALQLGSGCHWLGHSQGWEAEPKVGSGRIRLQETEPLCPGTAVPVTAPDCSAASPDPAGQWRTLERVRDSFYQLLSTFKKERRQVLSDNAILQSDRDRCHRQVCDLEEARARDAREIRRLEQANRELAADLAHLRGERGSYLQAISDLERCNRESYHKIVQLEDENERLEGDLGQLREARSARRRKPRGVIDCISLENKELKALIPQLGLRYQELIRDVELAVRDMLQALKGENEYLLCRVRGLEQMSSDMGVLVHNGQHPQGNATRMGDKVHALDKEVQVIGASGRLMTRVPGPPLEEEEGVCGVGTGHDSACGAGSPSPSSPWEHAEGPSTQQGSTGRAAAGEAHLGREEKGRWCSVDWAQALRPPGSGLQDAEAQVAEEEPRLCIQRLCHQVQTLQCQLRDQGWANRELQAARDQAVHLQDALRGELEELRREQREARLAVSPLKAKLASLVQKCLQRNRLIMRLLQELSRHGLASSSLTELVQGMVHDEALMEYTATFLIPGVTETSCCLDVDFEDAATGRGKTTERQTHPSGTCRTPGVEVAP
nr:uncharacterized protein C4orf50 homolog [Cavia porcellus]XP_013001994.1 uncharacterized protein C4orf50 homolog [Cavia porcellus]XP_023418423.1 uncharacterized protein C4orf50 homolog [Cavia porcellus]